MSGVIRSGATFIVCTTMLRPGEERGCGLDYYAPASNYQCPHCGLATEEVVVACPGSDTIWDGS